MTKVDVTAEIKTPFGQAYVEPVGEENGRVIHEVVRLGNVLVQALSAIAKNDDRARSTPISSTQMIERHALAVKIAEAIKAGGTVELTSEEVVLLRRQIEVLGSLGGNPVFLGAALAILPS